MANKYRMASYAWHYRQTLIIDSDVIVSPDAGDIFAAAGDSVLAGRDEIPDFLANGREGGTAMRSASTTRRNA